MTANDTYTKLFSDLTQGQSILTTNKLSEVVNPHLNRIRKPFKKYPYLLYISVVAGIFIIFQIYAVAWVQWNLTSDFIRMPETTITQYKDWVCPFDHPNKYKLFQPIKGSKKSNEKRFVDVRKDHYLFSLLAHGANGNNGADTQMRGFRDAVLLAYYLDRTIVLPDFIKQKLDSSYNEYSFNNNKDNLINIADKVDLSMLSKFINIVTMEELSRNNICKSGSILSNKLFDTAYFARSPKAISQEAFKRLQLYDQMYGFNITQKQNFYNFQNNPKIAKTQILPNSVTETGQNELIELGEPGAGENEIKLAMNDFSIKAAYGNTWQGNTFNGQCSIYINPFKSIKWVESLTTMPINFDEILAQKIMHHTMRPQAVRDIATEFLETRLRGQPFIAMHFKYDEQDIFESCKILFTQVNPDAEIDPLCKKAISGKLLKAKEVTQNIKKWLKLRKLRKIKYFYIATPQNPPKLEGFVKSLKRSFAEGGLFSPRTGSVFHSPDLEDMIWKKFYVGKRCNKDIYYNQIFEFVSQVEQEICSRSVSFIFSPSSAWSNAVNFERKAKFMMIEKDTSNEEFM